MAVVGPRQVGKTTLVQQVTEASGLATRFASADEPTLRGASWIEQQWEAARLTAEDAGRRGAVLVLDEIQKLTGWSESVKRLWDDRLTTAPKVTFLTNGLVEAWSPWKLPVGAWAHVAVVWRPLPDDPGQTVVHVFVEGQVQKWMFREKYELPFPLLIDEGQQLADAFGVEAYDRDGETYYRRSTVVIDADGKIAKAMEKVDPTTHADEVLAAL